MFQNKTSAQSIAWKVIAHTRDYSLGVQQLPNRAKTRPDQVQQFPILVKDIELETFFHVLNYYILIFVNMKNTIDN